MSVKEEHGRFYRFCFAAKVKELSSEEKDFLRHITPILRHEISQLVQIPLLLAFFREESNDAKAHPKARFGIILSRMWPTSGALQQSVFL